MTIEPDAKDRPRIPDFRTRPMRHIVVGLSAAFGVALTLLSILGRLYWHRESLASLFSTGDVVPRLAIGLALGAAGGGLALLVTWRVGALSGFRRLVREGFEGIEPRWIDLFAVSAVAGWSEELFFRGILQPKVGVWLAAVAFVAGHGVVRVRTRGRAMFAGVLFAAGVGLGYLYQWRGLEAAMAAHACYDLTVLIGLRILTGRRALV